jgi:hypothetical protein
VGTLAGILLAFLVVLLVSALVVAAVSLATVAVIWRRLRRRLRVAPGSKSPAPTSWLAGMNERARLHRRLRSATATARAAAAMSGGHLRPMAHEVELQAIAIERSLVAVPGRGRPARPARLAIAGEVSKLEAIAQQLSAIAVSRPTSPAVIRTPLETLQERVDALGQAHAELNRFDHRSITGVDAPGRTG